MPHARPKRKKKAKAGGRSRWMSHVKKEMRKGGGLKAALRRAKKTYRK